MYELYTTTIHPKKCLTGTRTHDPQIVDSTFLFVDIDECHEEPCEHGRCVDGINSYTCRCDNGYTGEHCEESKSFLLLHDNEFHSCHHFYLHQGDYVFSSVCCFFVSLSVCQLAVQFSYKWIGMKL